METFLNFTLSRIAEMDPLHYKKVKKNIKNLSEKPHFQEHTDIFFSKYDTFLKRIGKTREYAVDSYLRMISDVMRESVVFENTGKYSSKSFDEVNKRVYASPEIMDYYMHGLLMSQVLWKHHFAILNFFKDNLKHYKEKVKEYLEVGGGHGLYVNEAMSNFGSEVNYNVVDISESSLSMAKHFVDSKHVNFILSDVYKFFPERKYSFITMGEVLEHVEDPVSLLKKLHSLLEKDGIVFITTPTNAPAIDHIYLFRNVEDIREVIGSAGFNVVHELKMYAEDVPEEMAEQLKITLMYAAFIKKK